MVLFCLQHVKIRVQERHEVTSLPELPLYEMTIALNDIIALIIFIAIIFMALMLFLKYQVPCELQLNTVQ